MFDLSRSIDLHKLSTHQTNEEAVEGVMTGLIGMNETVTWKATHLFKTRFFTSKITGYRSPDYFRDEMQKGDFKKFSHEHFFKEKENGVTEMTDVLELETPYGLAGKFAMAIFLKGYITKFLLQRNQLIKQFAESDQWKKILQPR